MACRIASRLSLGIFTEFQLNIHSRVSSLLAQPPLKRAWLRRRPENEIADPDAPNSEEQVDKSEKSRHGGLRPGRKLLLVVRRPDGNRRYAYDRRPQPYPPGRAKPVRQIHCRKSGHCRDVAGDHSLHMAKPPKHLFSRWLDKSVDRTEPHAHSDNPEDNGNNAHRVS